MVGRLAAVENGIVETPCVRLYMDRQTLQCHHHNRRLPVSPGVSRNMQPTCRAITRQTSCCLLRNSRPLQTPKAPVATSQAEVLERNHQRHGPFYATLLSKGPPLMKFVRQIMIWQKRFVPRHQPRHRCPPVNRWQLLLSWNQARLLAHTKALAAATQGML